MRIKFDSLNLVSMYFNTYHHEAEIVAAVCVLAKLLTFPPAFEN